MAFIHDLFDCCRRGKLGYLRILVEEKEVELNVIDKWDSTPLYYACLCGHEKLVEYLLQNGAKCEANTFDGERCLYAALTQKIKEMLKSYKAITKDCIRRDNYVEFFKHCMLDETYKDFKFIVHGVEILVHRLILASRSVYFAEMFQTKWRNKSCVHLKHPLITVSAFKYMLQYLYTDRFDIAVREVDDLKRLCKQCELDTLDKKLDNMVKTFHMYTNSKPLHVRESVSVLSIQPAYGKCNLNQTYMDLVQYGIPARLRNDIFMEEPLPDIFFIDVYDDDDDDDDDDNDEDETLEKDKEVISFYPPSLLPFVDVCFVVHGQRFYAHMVFCCGRSEYFKSLVHFHEMTTQDHDGDNTEEIPFLTLNDISLEAFALILVFIYTNKVDIPEENIEEVLHFSTMYILPDLKRICAVKLASVQNIENILWILKLARFYDMTNLEASCCEFIANKLDEVIHQEEFTEIILSDAQQIENRQETDSIPIVDDIRFHLHKSALPGFHMEKEEVGIVGGNVRLEMLDELLQKLNLEC